MTRPRTFDRLTSLVVPLLRDDVDTDVIIPQTELVVTGTDGLAAGLFARWRYDEQRRPRPGFVLNDERYAGARILAAGRNFGCGSSRQHAVWALYEYGFRAVLAPSFGGIFQRNCLRSGLAPLELEPEAIALLVEAAAPGGRPEPVTLDLRAGTITHPGGVLDVDVPAEVIAYVVEGHDEISAAEAMGDSITDYERRRPDRLPWLGPLVVQGVGRAGEAGRV